MSEAVAKDFVAFQALVMGDPALVARLRPIMDREAFVAAVVAEGRSRGMAFAAAEVEAVCASNRQGWLLSWLPDA